MRALVLMSILLAACTRPSAVPPTSQETTVIGVPASTGSAPANVRTTLAVEGGESLTVTGPLAGEIRNLAGARVQVRGRRGADRTLEARDYGILSVSGRPVTVGVLEQDPNGRFLLRIDGRRTLPLRDAPPSFRVGMKVWVQGPYPDVVETYGIIRG